MSDFFDNLPSSLKCGLSDVEIDKLLELPVCFYEYDIEELPFRGEDDDMMDMPLDDEGDLFLTLPESDKPVASAVQVTIPIPVEDDEPIFSPDDIDDILPFGDDDNRKRNSAPDVQVSALQEDFDIDDILPLGDEDDEVPAPASDIQATAPVEERKPQEPDLGPATIQIPEPDPRLPWIERTQARFNAIRRGREDAEMVAQREIDEIVQALEGGYGGYEFRQFMDRLKNGEYTNPARVSKHLVFYLMMTFSTLDYKALCKNNDLTVSLWRDYGQYIPPARWREYVEKTERDDSIVVCVETFFKSVHDTYLHYMGGELAKREAVWEAAAMAVAAAEDYAHKAVDRTGHLFQGNVDVSRAARQKAEEAEARTAYGWRKALRYSAFTYSSMMDLDEDDMHKEYAAISNEFFAKLNEFREEEKR